MQPLSQVRDKIAQYGINAMTDAELLRAAKFKGSIDDFYKSYEYKATKELIRRREAPDRPKIKSSLDAYKLLSFLNDDSEESFYMVTLNRNQNVISTVFLSKGHDYAVVVGIKQIVLQAVTDKACNVILCHNHPSGNQNPSQQDIALTKSVKDALKLFDIQLLEHIIVARDNNYYSFADEGMI